MATEDDLHNTTSTVHSRYFPIQIAQQFKTAYCSPCPLSYNAENINTSYIPYSWKFVAVQWVRSAWSVTHSFWKPNNTCGYVVVVEKTPLSYDTTDSILRHREVGRAKDLSAPPRIILNTVKLSYIRNLQALNSLTQHIHKFLGPCAHTGSSWCVNTATRGSPVTVWLP